MTSPPTPSGSGRCRARSTMAVLGIACGLVLLTGGPASAHDELASSVPADGARLGAGPAQVELVFDAEPVPVGTQVVVNGPSGPVAAATPVLAGTSVRTGLPKDLAPGRYTVGWRVTAADGHPETGELAFTVGAPAATAVTVQAGPAAAEPAGAGAAATPLLAGVGALAMALVAAGLGLRRKD